ncbi:MAG: glycosyltransferase family 39 protein [Verrucomicrobiota bacterium]
MKKIWERFGAILRAYPFRSICVVVLLLYGSAMNPYVAPNSGDDTTYYQGALSLARGEGYREQGLFIKDWPPVQSLLTAVTMVILNAKGIWVGKVVNLFAVAAAACLMLRFMRREQRKKGELAVLILLISPTSYLVGSMTQADFTYLALSLLFFAQLHRLREGRSLREAIFVGLLFGVAGLTRYQGILLGLPLLFHLIGDLWIQRKSANLLQRVFLAPETIAGVLGGAMVFGWLAYVGSRDEGLVSNYEFQSSSIWWQPDPVELFAEFLNLLFQVENIILEFFPGGTWLIPASASVLLGLVVLGAFLRYQRFGVRSSDVYAMALGLLFCCYVYKEARYGIALAPFLFDYLFTAISFVAGKLRAGWDQPRWRKAAVGTWICYLLAMDSVLWLRGIEGEFGARLWVLVPTERSFVRGHYLDVFDASQYLKALPDANVIVAADKFHARIVRHYCGKETHFPGYLPGAAYTNFLQVDEDCFGPRIPEIIRKELAFPATLRERLQSPQRFGKVMIWEVADSPMDSKSHRRTAGGSDAER